MLMMFNLWEDVASKRSTSQLRASEKNGDKMKDLICSYRNLAFRLEYHQKNLEDKEELKVWEMCCE